MAKDERRADAERLYVKEGKSCAQIAAELGVSEGTIYRWKSEAQAAGEASDWDTARRVYNMSPRELVAMYAEALKQWVVKIKQEPDLLYDWEIADAIAKHVSVLQKLDNRSQYMGVALDLIKIADRWLYENQRELKTKMEPYWEAIYTRAFRVQHEKRLIMIRDIKTARELEKEWNKLKEEILSRPLFVDNSEKAKEERKKKCADSVWEFAQLYFPEYVSSEGAKFHKGWEKIRLTEKEPILLQAFRGSGKSTFFTLLDPIHEIAYGRRKFMLFSSYTEEKSERFTGRILLELMYNQRLKNDFGEFIPEGKRPAMGDFSVNIPGKKGSTIGVVAVSIGQDPRGFVHGAARPDYVRLDDIQNRKRAKSRKFVKESVEWIMQDLIPALAENYSCIIVATPLNTQCVAATLEKGSEGTEAVKTYKFPAEVRGKPA